MLPQHVQDLRDRHEDRDLPGPDLVDDVARVVAPHEHDDPGQHRRNEGRHGLAEHVAERQQVEEPDRAEWFRVAAVLDHLAFHRNDVREDVTVGDHDALRFGRRPGREDDFRNVVAPDLHGRRRALAVPVEFVKRPHLGGFQAANRRDVLSSQDHLRIDDAGDPHQKIRGRTVVDRHDDGADEQASPEGDDPLGPVFAEDDDLVTLDDA